MAKFYSANTAFLIVISFRTYCNEAVIRLRLRLCATVVYSAIASSFACMAETSYLPIFHTASDNLRVTREYYSWKD